MFEWDESKARENKSKHGISFADTFAVFEDPKCHHWNGRLRPHTGSGLHMAGGQHSDHFRTQGRALRGEAI